VDAVVRRIAAAFEASGMEQKELALRSGLPQSTLNQILRKGSGTFANVAKLAKALRLSVDDLLEDDAPVSSPITPYDANATYRSLVDALEDMPKDDRQEVLRFMLWMMKRTSGALGTRPQILDLRCRRH
jgi:transcriptional regulator with XRE-family HTH domain